MYKFIILFFMLFLTGCDITEIDENLYVVSMGLEYYEDTKETEVTLYFISSNSVAKKEIVSGSEPDVATATFRGKNEIEIIRRIETTHNQAFQFTHISSYILTTRYIEHVGFDRMIDDIINNPRRYPNYYVFSTEEKIKDVYAHKNIDNISTYYSIIFNPIQVYEQHTEIKVKRINELISEYYEGTLTPYVPSIRLNDSIWNEGDKQLKTIELYGYCYKGEKVNCYDIYKNPGIKYIHPSKIFIRTFEEYNVKIKKLKIAYKYENDTLIIITTMDALVISNIDHLSDEVIINSLSNFIKESILKLHEEKDDILRVNDYIYRNKKKPPKEVSVRTVIRLV